jgi:hypothetical protein
MRYEKSLAQRRKHKKMQNRRVSKRLKYCLTCKCVWEKDFNRFAPILRYQDFPTYGLEREICNVCTGKSK